VRTGKRSLLDEILGTIERRRHARFQLEAEVKIVSESMGLLPGRSVEISESGMAVLLPVELPLHETVRLVLTLPMGPLEINAIVRSRNAFRHGFEFVAATPSQELIRKSCGLLTPCTYEN
jgi:c-di-GMP-binding flagellar brake protein YcgR